MAEKSVKIQKSKRRPKGLVLTKQLLQDIRQSTGSWSSVASQLGITLVTLRRARKSLGMVDPRKQAIAEISREDGGFLRAAPPAPPLSDEESAQMAKMTAVERGDFMAERSEKAYRDYWDNWERNRQERIQARVAEIEAEEE